MVPVVSAAKRGRPSHAIGLSHSAVAAATAAVLGLALALAGSPGVAQAGEDPETTEEFEEVLIAELDAAGFDGQIATDGYMDAEAYVPFDGGEVFIHTWAAGDDVRRRPATLDGVTLLAGVPTQTGTWGIEGDPPIWTFSFGTKDYEVVGDGDLPLNSIEAFVIQFLSAQPCSSPVPLTAVSAPPAVFDGDPATVERIDEGDPILAAIAVSQARFPEAGGSSQVVIARVDVFADALAGAPLTAEAPLLFSDHDELPENSMAEIHRVATADAEIVILGGEHAVSADIEEELAALGYAPRRLAGPSRVETSVAIARVVKAMHPDVGGVAVARAEGTREDPTAGWADSISGGAYATRVSVPIVLTQADSLHPAVVSLLEELRPTRTYVFGGTAAITDAVVSQLPNAARIAGIDRADTAAHTAALFGLDVERMIVLNGYQPDGWTFGLLAAGIARATHAPVVYSDVSRVPTATLQRHQPRPGGTGIDTLLLGSAEQLDEEVAAALQGSE